MTKLTQSIVSCSSSKEWEQITEPFNNGKLPLVCELSTLLASGPIFSGETSSTLCRISSRLARNGMGLVLHGHCFVIMSFNLRLDRLDDLQSIARIVRNSFDQFDQP